VQLEYVPRGRLNQRVGAPEHASLGLRITLETTFFLLWRIATTAAVGLFLWAIAYTFSPYLAILTGLLILVGLPAIATMMAQVRARRSTIILSYIEQAVRLNLPLPRMLDAAQRSEQSRTAARLRRLRDLLEDGASLELALPVATPEVPVRTVGLIAAGEHIGSLRQTLMRLVKRPGESEDEMVSHRSFTLWYPLLMSIALILVLLLMLIFVIPKIEDLYKDFGLRPGYATLRLIHLSRAINDLEWLPLAMIAISLVWALGGAFRRIFSARRTAPWGVFDQILWRLPIAHGLVRDRGLADACNAMADALRAGYALPRAIEEASWLRLNVVLRIRLRKWRTGIESGFAADRAARDAQLPDLLCGMIGSGRGGDPAAAMEFLASYYESRFGRGRELIRAASVPLLALVFGGLVLFMASGTYMPLLQMMDRLSDNVLKVSK